MNVEISELRSQFAVSVVDSDPNSTYSLVETVKATGYQDVSFHPTLESALAMARENPPHLVLFDYENFEAEAETFLTELQAISPEILVILMAVGEQTLSSLQLVGRSLAYDTIARPFVSSLEISQKLDRAALRLYFQFESEQLREHLNENLNENQTETARPQQAQLAPVVAAPMKSTAASRFDARTTGNGLGAESSLADLNRALHRLSATKDLDQTISIFMESLSQQAERKPVLYFKYIPGHMSLLISHAVVLPIEKFRGVGIDLKKENPASLPELFRNPMQMEPIRVLLKDVFRCESYAAFGHFNEGEILGLFLVLDETDLFEEASHSQVLRRVFELAYKRNLTLKEKHALDIADPLTGLANRRHFAARLDEEISRARRILMPVSLITIDIDGIHRLNDRMGFQQADSIMKAIATILKKTTRANDIIARTGPDEFSCLMPHTGHLGGAVKAERIRRVIETTRFPLLEEFGLGPLTISCGVSEYPSFCGDAEGLIRSADEALSQVMKDGGNKVCLATAPPGFQMDFTPRENSSKNSSKNSSGPPLAHQRRET